MVHYTLRAVTQNRVFKQKEPLRNVEYNAAWIFLLINKAYVVSLIMNKVESRPLARKQLYSASVKGLVLLFGFKAWPRCSSGILFGKFLSVIL